jgi:putative ABC transport system permease protein
MRLYSWLLRLLPARVRERHGPELAAAFDACIERERLRLGPIGVAWASVRAVADIASAAILLRLDTRRARQVAALGHPPTASGDTAMMSHWQDVRYAARAMRRAPGFSAVVIATLALAIGVNTAIFSVVDGVLLQALPYREPARLVMLYEAIPGALSGPAGFSAPDYQAYETRVQSFEGIAAFGLKQFELSGTDRPERVNAARVSASLFDVLGVPPALGRPFTKAEDEGRLPVAILTDGLWRRKFNADPGIVGRTVSLDRISHTVVGVTPPGFVFPNRGPRLNNIPADLYVPISFTDRELTGFGSMFNNSVVARLKAGVAVAQADAEVKTISGRLVQEIYPQELKEMGLSLSAMALPLRDETVGNVETVLVVLMAAVGVVLLIACADIANLMLTRAAARSREMAVRAALGASRTALVRQVLVETLLLALIGGALGVMLAYWTTAALVRFAPATVPRLHEIGVDVRTLGFAVAVSFVAALLCGLLPAIELSRRPSSDSLKDSGRGGTASVRQRRTFGALVTAQFALAAVLLIGGGLLLRSFERLMAVDPGFRAERVLTMATSLPARAYPRAADVRGFYTRLLERIDALPGVSASATSVDLPLSVRERRAFTIELQPEASARVPNVVAHEWVAGRYFDALGISLKRGRYLNGQDTAQSEPVVVINETMARQFWPGLDPIGQRMAWGGRTNHGPWMRIVGIVADVKQGPLNTETFQQTYQPISQVSDTVVADNVWGGLRSQKVIVRGQADPAAMASAVVAQGREIDPSLPLAQVRTMAEVVSESAGPQRFNTILLGGFAALALVLASLGIAGVLATSVSRRTQEIGVRMALGAQRGDLLRMVIRQGMLLAILGVSLGVPVAFGVTRLMSSMLFEVSPRDPVTFGGVAMLLIAVAFVACYIPARRATRVDPIVALRYE